MFKTIVGKEVLENILSYRFPLFSLICLLLIPLGMSVNQANYAQRVRDYSEQVRLADEAAAALKIQDIMAGTVAIKGFRRPAPLSVFTQGFENTLPRYYEFTQDGFKPGESASGDESILSVQGQVDFVFLVQMVLSLIALLFASDMISGEKESGTLRAMLANRSAPGRPARREDRGRLPGPVDPVHPRFPARDVGAHPVGFPAFRRRRRSGSWSSAWRHRSSS